MALSCFCFSPSSFHTFFFVLLHIFFSSSRPWRHRSHESVSAPQDRSNEPQHWSHQLQGSRLWRQRKSMANVAEMRGLWWLGCYTHSTPTVKLKASNDDGLPVTLDVGLIWVQVDLIWDQDLSFWLYGNIHSGGLVEAWQPWVRLDNGHGDDW